MIASEGAKVGGGNKMVTVGKQGYLKNSKRVPRLTGGGHGAPRGYKGVKGDLFTAARRRWPVKGVFLEALQIWLKSKYTGCSRANRWRQKGTGIQNGIRLRLTSYAVTLLWLWLWLCSGGVVAVKEVFVFEVLPIQLKIKMQGCSEANRWWPRGTERVQRNQNVIAHGGGSGCAAAAMRQSRKCFVQSDANIDKNQNARGIPKRTGGGPGAPKGYRGTKSDVLTPAAAVAVQWRRWDDQVQSVANRAKNQNAKDIPKRTGGGPGVPKGYRGTKNDMLTTAAAVAVQRRRWDS